MRSSLLFSIIILGATAVHAGPSPIDVAALSRLVTSETADLTAARVVGAAEMRDALNLEAEKEAAGCLDTSCIAEIAAAMGTSHVLQTQLGAIGSTLLLSIQVFDDNARVLSRESIRGESLDDIGRQLHAALDHVLTKSDLRKDAANKHSLLILDVKASVERAVSTATTDIAGAPSLLFWGGAATLGLGVLGVVVSGVLGGIFVARNGDLRGATQKDVLFWQASAVVAAGVTSVIIVGGATILGTEWLIGDNHAE